MSQPPIAVRFAGSQEEWSDHIAIFINEGYRIRSAPGVPDVDPTLMTTMNWYEATDRIMLVSPFIPPVRLIRVYSQPDIYPDKLTQ